MSGPLRVAVMTPAGRGAVAVIRVSGDHTMLDLADPPLFRPANQRPIASQAWDRILFGQWGHDSPEDVVVSRWHADTLEIHCHGGHRAVERILQNWRGLGAEVVDWRTMLASTNGFLEAELQDCLSRAITWRTAEFLLQQSDGLLRNAFDSLHQTVWTTDHRIQAINAIDQLSPWSEFGLHLCEPWKVVLTGKPNVGKSSLINALLGYERSIVYDQPGTTRDAVTAITAMDGWPIQLTDTAGIRAVTESLEMKGIARARQQLSEADLVLTLVDLSDALIEIPETLPDREMLIAHKSDLADRGGPALPDHAIRVSSVTGEGLDRLQHEIARRLVPVPPDAHTPLPVTPRQITLLQSMRAALADGSESAYRTAVEELLHGPQ